MLWPRRTQVRCVVGEGFPSSPFPQTSEGKVPFAWSDDRAEGGCDPAFIPGGLCYLFAGRNGCWPPSPGIQTTLAILQGRLHIINPVSPEEIGWKHLLIHDGLFFPSEETSAHIFKNKLCACQFLK